MEWRGSIGETWKTSGHEEEAQTDKLLSLILLISFLLLHVLMLFELYDCVLYGFADMAQAHIADMAQVVGKCACPVSLISTYDDRRMLRHSRLR